MSSLAPSISTPSECRRCMSPPPRPPPVHVAPPLPPVHVAPPSTSGAHAAAAKRSVLSDRRTPPRAVAIRRTFSSSPRLMIVTAAARSHRGCAIHAQVEHRSTASPTCYVRVLPISPMNLGPTRSPRRAGRHVALPSSPPPSFHVSPPSFHVSPPARRIDQAATWARPRRRARDTRRGALPQLQVAKVVHAPKQYLLGCVCKLPYSRR